jgi:hypothetical protein
MKKENPNPENSKGEQEPESKTLSDDSIPKGGSSLGCLAVILFPLGMYFTLEMDNPIGILMVLGSILSGIICAWKGSNKDGKEKLQHGCFGVILFIIGLPLIFIGVVCIFGIFIFPDDENFSIALLGAIFGPTLGVFAIMKAMKFRGQSCGSGNGGWGNGGDGGGGGGGCGGGGCGGGGE